MEKSNKKWLQDWIKLERLVPLAIIGLAGSAFILERLGIVTLSVPEGLVLAVLGLLAFDALGERMGILKRIQDSLDLINKAQDPKPWLMLESELLLEMPLEKYLDKANELFISGGSLHGLLAVQPRVIERWLSQTRQAKLLLILVDPDAVRTGKVSVQHLHISQDKDEYARHIDSSLRTIKKLQKSFPGKVEYRLTDQVPSMTVLMINHNKARVSLNLYLTSPDQRPIFELSRSEHPKWFELFQTKYYIELWEKSELPT